jgi:acyl-CoA reductase-like NAD-dependent aldehyde dehydrogenase
LIAHRSIASPLLERVAERAGRIRIGPPLDESTEMGSLISTAARDRCIDLVDDAVSDRARLIVGGAAPLDSALDGEAEAIALANAGRYGLTAAIWTQDLDRALRLTDAIEAGYVWVNDVETRFPAVPFGGWKDSGVGTEHGIEEIRSFTRVKAVNVRVR